jgi:hypothetical protein
LAATPSKMAATLAPVLADASTYNMFWLQEVGAHNTPTAARGGTAHTTARQLNPLQRVAAEAPRNPAHAPTCLQTGAPPPLAPPAVPRGPSCCPPAP